MLKYLLLYWYKKRNRYVRDLISKSTNFHNRISSEMEFLKNEKKSTNKQYPNFLSICAIMKDEGPYLKEWIEYHKLIGVDKFYLYDNESTDDTKQVLQPYIDSGLVEYIYWPGIKQQLVAYNDCVEKHKNDTKWMTFIDLDEFICNPINNPKYNIVNYLKSLPYYYTQIFLKWIVFGSAGQKEFQPGLVIERFKWRAKKHIRGEKAIVNPRALIRIEIHRHDVFGITATPSEKKLRLNHYQVKSYGEFKKRISKGDAFFGVNKSIDLFAKNDKNEVYDSSMDETINLLKQFFDDNKFKYTDKDICLEKSDIQNYERELSKHDFKPRFGNYLKRQLIHYSSCFIIGRENRRNYRKWLAKVIKYNRFN